MKKTTSNDELHDFAWYVENHCYDIELKEAVELASKGEEILKLWATHEFTVGNDREIKEYSENIVWCLLKMSYDAGIPFGKGSFILDFGSNEINDKIYKSLFKITGQEGIYDRISSHLRPQIVEGTKQMGVDFKKKRRASEREKTKKLGFRFQTLLLGLHTLPTDNSKQILLFKPEDAGLSLEDPAAAVQHMWLWAKHASGFRATIAGTVNCREDEPLSDSRPDANEPDSSVGSAPIIVVTPEKLDFKSKELSTRLRETRKGPSPSGGDGGLRIFTV